MYKNKLFKKLSVLLSFCLMCMLALAEQAQANFTGLEKVKHHISGLWEVIPQTAQEKSIFYYFASDGTLAILNQNSATGISYNILDESTVQIISIPMPRAKVNDENYQIVSVGFRKFSLQNAKGEQIHFKKSREKVSKIMGKLSYRERIALPPSVDVSIKLYAHTTPLASSFMPRQGNQGLDFEIYFLEQTKNTKLSLEASIYNGYTKLFSTASAIALEEKYIFRKSQAEPLIVPLKMSDPFESSKNLIEAPVSFVSPDGNYKLFLEQDGFGILKKKNKSEIIQWNQVDRNYNLEILPLKEQMIFATIPSQNELVLSHLDGQDSVALIKTPEVLVQEDVKLTALYTENNGQGILTDCVSKHQFNLDVEANQALYQKFLEENKQVGLVEVEATIYSQNNELDLKVNKLNNYEVGKSCPVLSQNAGLHNTYWRLLSVNNKAGMVYENQTEPHLIIKQEQATGSDGCNNFFLPVMIKKSSIDFGAGGSTLKLCPNGEEQALEILRSLDKVNNWEINGSILNLRDENQTILRFEAVYF